MKRLTTYAFAALAFGCSGPTGPDTVPATGTVTYEGSAVENAIVVFTPTGQRDTDQQSLAAQAETDELGRFELSTYVGGEDYKPGIETGTYNVTVTKLEVVQDMRRKPKHLLPKKFSQPSTSGLSVEVTENGDNDFKLEL